MVSISGQLTGSRELGGGLITVHKSEIFVPLTAPDFKQSEEENLLRTYEYRQLRLAV